MYKQIYFCASVGEYRINEMNEKSVNKFLFNELIWKRKIEQIGKM